MDFASKRSTGLRSAAVQEGNKKWWTAHTMSCDWKDASRLEKFSSAWFDDIDRRFLHAARLNSNTPNPFSDLMAVEQLRGRRVLEIGCGMGFHSEMLARAGADVSATDLSPTSVDATKRRIELRNLRADVRQMDAEVLDFPSGSFDMVWSWGVIHHSSRTGRIVREIERVLRPGGKARIMVYNLEGMPTYIVFVTRYLLGFWRGRSLDEMLRRSTDGFNARSYTASHCAEAHSAVAPARLGASPGCVPVRRGRKARVKRPGRTCIEPARRGLDRPGSPVLPSAGDARWGILDGRTPSPYRLASMADVPRINFVECGCPVEQRRLIS
jgi:2-polyprenyl-3-methyl-5-hydroxy-6-metoxy-1,4-benzoquinol methylase